MHAADLQLVEQLDHPASYYRQKKLLDVKQENVKAVTLTRTDGSLRMEKQEGGWRIVEPGLGEVKRMYVAASHRGRGLSRLLLAEIERSAALAGLKRLRLETGDRQPEAKALYESSGWIPIPKFGVYKDEDGSFCFGKEL